MDYFGTCLQAFTITSFKVTTSTINNYINKNQATPNNSNSIGQSFILPLILLVVLLIFFILLIMLYCIQRKGTKSKKMGKAKKLHADYLSKGNV